MKIMHRARQLGTPLLVRGGTGQQQEIPTVREPRMGSCTIQLVRVPREESANNIDPKDRLWWVTPATAVDDRRRSDESTVCRLWIPGH